MCMQLLRAAAHEGDLNSMQMLGLRQVGSVSGDYSVRLTDDYTLIFELKACSPRSLVKVRVISRSKCEQ